MRLTASLEDVGITLIDTWDEEGLAAVPNGEILSNVVDVRLIMRPSKTFDNIS